MIDNNLIQKTKGLNLIYTRASTLCNKKLIYTNTRIQILNKQENEVVY